MTTAIGAHKVQKVMLLYYTDIGCWLKPRPPPTTSTIFIHRKKFYVLFRELMLKAVGRGRRPSTAVFKVKASERENVLEVYNGNGIRIDAAGGEMLVSQVSPLLYNIIIASLKLLMMKACRNS